MTKKNKRLELYVAILLLVSVIAVTLRTVALFIDFDTETNYFDSKILINIASIFLAISAVFLFSYTFFTDSKKPLIASFTSPATFVPTTVAVISLVYFAIGAFSRVKSSDLTLQQAVASKDTMYLIWALLAILSLLAIAYFVLNAVVEKRASVARASFGLAAVLFLALYSAHFFFSTELQLNAPNKVVDQLAYLFAALFFLYEIRISLGRECWNLYVSFGFVSAALLAYSSFPTLIYYIANGTCVSASIYEIALSISLFLFVVSRLFLTASLVEDRVDDTVALIKEAFEKKNEALAEKNAHAIKNVIPTVNFGEDIPDPTFGGEDPITEDDVDNARSAPISDSGVARSDEIGELAPHSDVDTTPIDPADNSDVQ